MCGRSVGALNWLADWTGGDIYTSINEGTKKYFKRIPVVVGKTAEESPAAKWNDDCNFRMTLLRLLFHLLASIYSHRRGQMWYSGWLVIGEERLGGGSGEGGRWTRYTVSHISFC